MDLEALIALGEGELGDLHVTELDRVGDLLQVRTPVHWLCRDS